MKILFIASSSDWHVDLWVKYFSTRYEVFLFSDNEQYLGDQDYSNIEIIKSNGIIGWFLNIFKIKYKYLYQVNKIISAWYYAKLISKIITKHEVDVVHSHSLYYGYVCSYLNISQPIVFTPMGSDVIIHAQNNILYKYMAKRAFKNADIVTGDSKLLQKRGLNVGAKMKNNYIIQNGVDSKLFFPKKESDLKNKLKLKDNELIIFSPRAITPLYNIEIIMDALSILKLSNIDFKCLFTFAFGGDYLDALKKRVRDLNLERNIIWIGYTKYNEMAKYYNVSDIIISIPSSDSSPKSVYEGMFCGKPIIVSDLEWCHEILSQKNCLHILNETDANSVSEAILLLTNDNNYRNILSYNAVKCAKLYFDYDLNMRVMEKIMEETVRANL